VTVPRVYCALWSRELAPNRETGDTDGGRCDKGAMPGEQKGSQGISMYCC
jgi:hypothetical protein